MTKAFQRAGKRLAKAGAAVLALPGWLWSFAMQLKVDPNLRDITVGHAVFVGIFAFGLASVDFLLTSGVEWSAGFSAVAAEPTQQHALAQPRVSDELSPIPQPALAELQRLDEMAAPNEDLLGGPDVVLAAWARDGVDQLGAQ